MAGTRKSGMRKSMKQQQQRRQKKQQQKKQQRKSMKKGGLRRRRNTMRGGAKYTADEDGKILTVTLEEQEKLKDGSQIVIVTPGDGDKEYKAVVVGKEGEGEAAPAEEA